MLQRFKEITDWASRFQLLWFAATWLFAHIPILAGGVAVIAVVWAYLSKVSPVFIAIAGLLAFGTILWIGNNVGAWLERRKKVIPPSNKATAKSDTIISPQESDLVAGGSSI
jgi:hypothetical protein